MANKTISFLIADSFLSRVLIPELKESAIGDLWEAHNLLKRRGTNRYIAGLITSWRGCLLIKASIQIYYSDTRQSARNIAPVQKVFPPRAMSNVVHVRFRSTEKSSVAVAPDSRPMCLSNLQSEQADKEASMLSSFSTSNKSGNSLPNYGAVNQCPESLTSSGVSPLANGSREKVVPITPQIGELEALRGRVALMSHQQAELEAKLSVALDKIQDMAQTEERMDARMSQFEQTYRQEQIEQSRLKHAQDCQLERKLQDFIKASVTQAVQYTMETMERSIPDRRAAAPEPIRQPSTYIVPDGPCAGYSN